MNGNTKADYIEWSIFLYDGTNVTNIYSGIGQMPYGRYERIGNIGYFLIARGVGASNAGLWGLSFNTTTKKLITSTAAAISYFGDSDCSNVECTKADIRAMENVIYFSLKEGILMTYSKGIHVLKLHPVYNSSTGVITSVGTTVLADGIKCIYPDTENNSDVPAYMTPKVKEFVAT